MMFFVQFGADLVSINLLLCEMWLLLLCSMGGKKKTAYMFGMIWCWKNDDRLSIFGVNYPFQPNLYEPYSKTQILGSHPDGWRISYDCHHMPQIFSQYSFWRKVCYRLQWICLWVVPLIWHSKKWEAFNSLPVHFFDNALALYVCNRLKPINFPGCNLWMSFCLLKVILPRRWYWIV